MKKPAIHPSVFVAPGAVVRGDVQLAAGSSVFYNAVLRGDRAAISIGEGTNIQDNCVVHVEYGLPVTVGKNVTVGHGATPQLHHRRRDADRHGRHRPQWRENR